MLSPGMFGKVLGSIVGTMIGLLVGSVEATVGLAIAGLVLGHLFFDRASEAPTFRDERPPSMDELLTVRRPRRLALRKTLPTPRGELARALAPIFIDVARADGEVSQAEIRVTREFFQEDLGFAGDDLDVLKLALKDALHARNQDLDGLLKEARRLVKPSERLLVVNALYSMALVDGDLRKSETECLKRVTQNFNLSEEQLLEITQMYLGSGRKHYEALGLTEAATDDEIRSTYRRLAAENHPDRAAHLGRAEAEKAAERFRQVKDAFEELKKLRGF